MMAPDPCYGQLVQYHTVPGEQTDRWYMMKKPGGGLLDRLGITRAEPVDEGYAENEEGEQGNLDEQ